MKKIVLFLLALLLSCAALPGKSTVIRVRNQYEFSVLQSAVNQALKSGYTDIRVVFDKGIYFFSEKHFNLSGLNYPGASIVYDGGDAVLVGEGTTVYARRKKAGRYVATWFNYDRTQAIINLDKLQDVRPFGTLRKSTGPIQVVNEASRLCRMKADEKDNSRPSGMAIQFSSWYLGYICPVEKIEKGYIYFRPEKLTKSGRFYNIEGDRNYGGTDPKYQLINCPEADVWWSGNKLRFKEKGTYHICRASQAIVVANCKFKSLEFKNFTFLGNSESAEILSHFYGTEARLSINHCRFQGIRNLVLSSLCDHVTLSDNTVEGCYRGFFRVFPQYKDNRIIGNVFRDNQLYLNNTITVQIRGKDFLVKDNIFEDFTCCAIGIGNHFAEKNEVFSSGVVENNEIYYTEAYRKEPTHTLMDSGAIYCWTIQDNVIIRNNYIHDYVGTKDNRGIFGDDGTCNTTVTGNRILRIGNSYCIDFRRVEAVEKMSNSSVKKTNVGIKMYDNTIDGTVRFEPRPGDKTSRKGNNKIVK